MRSADLRSASRTRPSDLQVVADIAAGSAPAIRLLPGQAARIMTGAHLPRGADSVVMLEDTDQARAPKDAAAPRLVRAVREHTGGHQYSPDEAAMPEPVASPCAPGQYCARRSWGSFPCWGNPEFASIGDR